MYVVFTCTTYYYIFFYLMLLFCVKDLFLVCLSCFTMFQKVPFLFLLLNMPAREK